MGELGQKFWVVSSRLKLNLVNMLLIKTLYVGSESNEDALIWLQKMEETH